VKKKITVIIEGEDNGKYFRSIHVIKGEENANIEAIANSSSRKCELHSSLSPLAQIYIVQPLP